MTGGQFGATTPMGAVTTTTPYGNFEYPFNLPLLTASLGAPFVARWTTLHVKQLGEAMERAMEVDGFAFIEIVSPCPIGFGRKNEFKTAMDQMNHYLKRSIVDDDADLREVELTMKPDDRIVVGNFVDRERIPYLEGQRRMLAEVLEVPK